MKNLIEISKIVTKRKVKKIEIFDEYYLKHKNSKFNDFYEALVANKFKNDRDAATFLYSSTPTDPKYRQLKSRFKKRLLNTLFFLDVNLPATASYERAYYSTNKDWTLVKILQSNNATLTANSMAKQILTTALKFRFADVVVNASRILREYAADMGDEKAFEQYNELIQTFSAILKAEIRSEELYQLVKLKYFKPPSKRDDDLYEKVDQYCDAMVQLDEQYESPVIHYNMYLVWILRFEMHKDYKTMLEICSQADKYLEKQPDYYQEEKLIIFQTKKMLAFLHLQDYDNGKITAEQCLNQFPEGSPTWFSFMEYYLLLTIHTSQFIQAIAIYNQAVANSKFKKLDNISKEKWNLYEAFLNYIIHYVQSGNPILQRQQRKRFSITKFIEKPVLFPKEQRIFTILILILQVIFLIEKRNLTAASERIERLKNYANRQLKKDVYFRPIQFIRLLQQLKKANYQSEDLRNTEKYLNLLELHEFTYRGTLYELEIIPYEQLWRYLVSRI